MKRNTVLALACACALIGWVVGFMSSNTIVKMDTNNIIYRSGKVPYDIPLLLFYQESNGVITATSAIHVDQGRILEYSVTGKPVYYDLLGQPMAYIELSKYLVSLVKD